MTGIDARILRESATARNEILSLISSQGAIELLNEVKEIKFQSWSETDFVTVVDLADYYSVNCKEIRGFIKRRNYALEFSFDRVETLIPPRSGEAYYAIYKTRKKSPLIIIPALGALRMAILLSDQSAIAKKVVDVLIQKHGSTSSDGNVELLLKSLSDANKSISEANFKMAFELAELQNNFLEIQRILAEYDLHFSKKNQDNNAEETEPQFIFDLESNLINEKKKPRNRFIERNGGKTEISLSPIF